MKRIMNFNIHSKFLYSCIVRVFEFIGDHSHFEFGLCGGAVNQVALYGRNGGEVEFTLC